ncbi:MAG TPA: hypothetical protein VK149_12505 [Sideroxyarcus sp.]|nr:hypothetical protein [Sideroxyarcus sp.]
MTTTRMFLYNKTRRAQIESQRVFFRLMKAGALLCAFAFFVGYLRG